MKLNKKLFFASALLLLGVLEVTPFIAVTLGVGLFLFSILYSNGKKVRNRRLILASSLIVISVLALLAYHLATANLLAAETTGQYANVPSMLKLVAFEAQQTSSLTNVGSSVAAVSSKISLLNVGFVAYGVWIALLSFGIAVIFCPELAIVFAGPWFAELFLARNYNFTLVWLPYFSYVLGGTIVAATLGIMLAQEKRGYAYWILSKIRGKGHGPMLAKLVLVTLVVSIVALNIIYPFFVSSKVKSSELTNVTQDLLFQVSPQQSLMYRQLGSIVKLLPANASVMTQFYIVPHLISRQDMELIPNAGFGVTHVNNFTPEYILVDLNQSVVPYIETPVVPYEQGYVYNLTKNASAGYSLWAQNGSALLYKRS